MSLLRPFLLGTVQGITEFLPISSSAHLILVPWILGWPHLGLAFDVALHLGTLFALLLYFAADWKDLARAFWESIKQRRLAGDPRRRMSWLILLASLPAALVGLLAEETIERYFRHPLPIAAMAVLLGAALLYADNKGVFSREEEEISAGEALLIGLAQAGALFPGVSRSGATITAGLLIGLRREAAARFSFLLASPVVAGAALLEGMHLIRSGIRPSEGWLFSVGVFSATLSGFLSIRYLLRYLRRGSLAPFAYYRIILGLAVFLLSVTRGAGR